MPTMVLDPQDSIAKTIMVTRDSHVVAKINGTDYIMRQWTMWTNEGRDQLDVDWEDLAEYKRRCRIPLAIAWRTGLRYTARVIVNRLMGTRLHYIRLPNLHS